MQFEHIPNTSIKEIFSDDRDFRYCLEIIKDNNASNDTKTVCVIMQNPSVANEKVADKSIQFLEKLILETTLLGKLPSISLNSFIEKAALCPPYLAWKCGGA